MSHPLEAGTIRILKPDGSTAGTGFLVSKRLAVTCAHVVESAKAKPGEVIKFEYHLGNAGDKAKVLEKGWSPENDIAILELTNQPPKWIRPIIMQSSQSMEGHGFQGLGYPDDGQVQTRWIHGTIGGLVQVNKYSTPLLQIQGKEIDKGLSGGAVLDRTTQRVIGMITSYLDIARQRAAPSIRFGYVIPIETIWKIYPDLEKEMPSSPKRSPLVEGINLLPYDYAGRIQNFLAEYLGTAERPEPFGGRETALKTLDKWLDSDTQRLLLAAPAGRGKSALLVRWLDSLVARTDLALVFVPVSVRFRTNLAITFFASLAARLAYLHGEDIPTSMETSGDVWRGLASTYLTRSLADEKKLLIVLDGLDETGDWEATPDFVPADLPNNVHIVVSARFLAGDVNAQPWLSRLGWERKGAASTLDLTPLDSSGVADVLKLMGFPLNELSHRVDIVAELHRLSGGDPLLVNLYVEDLWSRGKRASRLQPGELRDIKPGYEGYFDRWWDDQKKLWKKDAFLQEQRVQTLLSLLATALGPLSKNDLISLVQVDLNSYLIEDVLDTLKRFIIGDGMMLDYSFSHPKLGQYFWDKLTSSEKTTLEKTYIDWGERTVQYLIKGQIRPVDVSHYLLRYYSVHLERARAGIEKYVPLVDCMQWAQAWFAFEGAYGGYLQDVKRIWKVCEKIDIEETEKTENPRLIGYQIRCALIETTLHSLANNIPPKLIIKLVKTGTWNSTQGLVYIRQITESHQRAEVLEGLIDILTKDFAADTLSLVQGIQSEASRANLLASMIEWLPSELCDRVLLMAREITLKKECIFILTELAFRLSKESKNMLLHETLMVTGKIIDEQQRAIVLCSLIERFPDDLLNDLLEAVNAIDDPFVHLRVLSKLIARLPNKQRIAEARETVKNARKLIRGTERNAILIELSNQLPEEEKIAILKDLLSETPPSDQIELLNLLITKVDSITEEFLSNIFFEMTRKLSSDDLTIQWLSLGNSVAWSEFVGKLPDKSIGNVLEEVQNINSITLRTQMLLELTKKTQGETRSVILKRALLDVRHNESTWGRTALLPEIIDQVSKESSRDILDEALQVVRELNDERLRVRLLSSLAGQLPAREQAEILDEALLVARNIKDRVERVLALGKINTGLLEEERSAILDEILLVTMEIGNKGEKIRVLSQLAWQLSEKERQIMLGEVISTLRKIWDKSDQNYILNSLVEQIPVEYGQWNAFLSSTLSVIRDIGDERDYAFMLTELAKQLPERLLSDVLIATQNIWREGNRISVLTALVERSPDKLLSEILRNARATWNKAERALLLCELTKRIPEDLSTEALLTVQNIENEQERSRVLKALVLRLPQNALGKALSIARKIEDDSTRANVLSEFIKVSPEYLIDEIYSMAQEINKEDRELLFNEMVGRLPNRLINNVMAEAQRMNYQYRIPLMCSIADKLSNEKRSAILEELLLLIHSIPDMELRVNLMIQLIKHLPTAERDKISDEILKLVQSMQDPRNRAIILVSLSMYLSDVRRDIILNEALSEVRRIEFDWDKVETLKIIIMQLPEGLFNPTLTLVQELDNEEDRLQLLGVLVERYPEKFHYPFLSNLLIRACGIRSDSDRAKLLSILSRQLSYLETSRKLQLWCQTLSKLSIRTRKSLFSDLSGLMPLILSLDRGNVLEELFVAICDVDTWWP